MNADFTPPKVPAEAPTSPVENSADNANNTDWIAAALPHHVSTSAPSVSQQSFPRQVPYSPVPTPGLPTPGLPTQPQGDGTGGLIPYKNPTALIGYYVSVFGLIPCAGLILGPTAIVLGIMGIKYNKQNPHTKGVAHAWVAIVLGSIELLAHLAFIGAGIFGATR